MAGAQVLPPFPIFTDVDGDPLDDGLIYVGQDLQTPGSSVPSLFWDRELTIPATSPISTRDGYPSNAGVRSIFYSSEPTYSITVINKHGTTVYQSPSSLSSTDLEARLIDPSHGSNMVAFDGDQPTVEDALITRAKGNPGVTYNLIGGAIRRDTAVSPNWQFISDSAHKLSNLLTITDGVEVGITYNGSKIVTLVCGSDERWSSAGIQIGASVGASNALLRMGAPCTFTIDLDNLVDIGTDLRLFRVGRFGGSIAASGLITLTHPQRQTEQKPVIQWYSDSSSEEIATVFDIRASSAGVSTLYLKRRMAGRIEYTGVAWAASNTPFPNSDYSFSYDTGTGLLTVTHPDVSGNVTPQLTPYGAGAVDYVSSIVSSTATTMVVKFRKLSDGSIPVGTPTLMGFTFDRGENAIDQTPNGKLHVDLGQVQVDMNDVDFPLGNAWIIGIMEA